MRWHKYKYHHKASITSPIAKHLDWIGMNYIIYKQNIFFSSNAHYLVLAWNEKHHVLIFFFFVWKQIMILKTKTAIPKYSLLTFKWIYLRVFFRWSLSSIPNWNDQQKFSSLFSYLIICSNFFWQESKKQQQHNETVAFLCENVRHQCVHSFSFLIFDTKT